VSNAVEVTDATFERDVLKSDKPVMVDFWAIWCGPCRALAPTVDAIAQSYADKLKVVKLDADTNQQSVMRYGVMGLPTLIVFKNGQEVKRLVGNQPRSAIERELAKVLS